jgi:hypothetical protein
MDSRLEKIVSDCTHPLADDPELELDIAQELRTHLTEKCEELKREGLSDEKAIEEAVKEFGDSMEISESLFQANLQRFRFRAKLRLAAKLLFFPLLLVGLCWAMNFRLFEGISVYCEVIGIREAPSIYPISILADGWAAFQKLFFRASGDDRMMSSMLKGNRELTSDELLIVFGDASAAENEKISPDIARQKAIWERFPENKVYLANYIQCLINDSRRDYVFSEICKARSIEPENAAYDYILCGLLLEEALEPAPTADKTEPPERFYLLRDRQKLDQAMAELKKGMGKPYYRLYIQDMFRERMRILNLPQDCTGQLLRLLFSSKITLPSLKIEREILRAIPFYAHLLQAEGKQRETEFYLDAWKHIVSQFNDDSFTIVGQLTIQAGLNAQYKSAIYRNDARRAKELKIALEPLDTWRAKRPKRETDLLYKHSGVMSGMFLPALADDASVAGQLTPERNLTYTLMDTAALAIQAAMILFFLLGDAVILFLLYLKGQRPYLILLPWKTALKTLLLGLLLPIGLYLLYSRIDFLGGHNLALSRNITRFLPGILFFILVPPLLFGYCYWRALKRRGYELGYQKMPLSMYCLNLLFAGLAALFLTSAIMKPILAYEQKHYVKIDTLFFNGEYFSAAEDRFIKEMNEKRRIALQKAMQIEENQPIPDVP